MALDDGLQSLEWWFSRSRSSRPLDCTAKSTLHTPQVRHAQCDSKALFAPLMTELQRKLCQSVICGAAAFESHCACLICGVCKVDFAVQPSGRNPISNCWSHSRLRKPSSSANEWPLRRNQRVRPVTFEARGRYCPACWFSRESPHRRATNSHAPAQATSCFRCCWPPRCLTFSVCRMRILA